MSDAKFAAVIAELNKRREKTGVNIDGKTYSMVKDRVDVFRENFGASYGIDTHVEYKDFSPGSVVVATAKIIDIETGNTLASGTAMEICGTNMVNEYSPVECAETSAIGRALACFGLHGGEYASSNEMQGVGRKQEAKATAKPASNSVPAPRKPSTNFYVPEDHDAIWLQPDVEQRKVLEEISRVRSVNDLGKYWGDLGFFIHVLTKEAPPLLAELKAAFAEANNRLEFDRGKS